MKKKTILNTIMILIIVTVAAGGFLAVNMLKNKPTADSGMTVSEKTGIVTLERGGVAYETDSGAQPAYGDTIRTNTGSEVSVDINNKILLTLAENTEVNITKSDKTVISVAKGEAFIILYGESAVIKTPESEFSAADAVFSVTVSKSADKAFVYSGELKAVNIKNGIDLLTEAGRFVELSDKAVIADTSEISVSELNDWQIDKLLECSSKAELCFSQSELTQLKADRKSEKEQAQQNSLKGEEDTNQYVTMEIVCSTILDNMDSLAKGKETYVPEDGAVLKASQIPFEEGETVFDILKKACEITGIHLEYSYTPLYESYYIEGINQIYEFDCGPESGWNYKVNGWFPNYGCSSYIVKDGDAIVWCYTCNGLGADVGAKISE